MANIVSEHEDDCLRIRLSSGTTNALTTAVIHAVAQIELAEGVRLTANVVDCPVDALRVGLPVEVVFDRVTEALTLPRFRPRQG